MNEKNKAISMLANENESEKEEFNSAQNVRCIDPCVKSMRIGMNCLVGIEGSQREGR